MRADFGGLYMDQAAGGIIMVALTTTWEDIEDEVRALSPSGATVRFRLVPHTMDQLERITSAIRSDLDSGDLFGQIVSLGVLEAENVVEVTLRAGAKITPAALSRRYGPSIRVIQDPGTALTSCTDWRNCAEDPWRGGLAIDNPATNATDPDCSSGFVAKAPSGGAARKMMTAGHCGAVDTTWQHDGIHFGTLNSPNRYVSGSDADVALINIVDDWAGNEILVGAPTALGAAAYRSITSQQGIGGDTVGDTVCNGGYRTKDQTGLYKCGLLEATNLTICANPAICIGKLRRAAVRVANGDSGGPVFNAGQALGLVHAGQGLSSDGKYFLKMYYSHIYQVTDELAGWTVQTTP